MSHVWPISTFGGLEERSIPTPAKMFAYWVAYPQILCDQRRTARRDADHRDTGSNHLGVACHRRPAGSRLERHSQADRFDLLGIGSEEPDRQSRQRGLTSHREDRHGEQLVGDPSPNVRRRTQAGTPSLGDGNIAA